MSSKLYKSISGIVLLLLLSSIFLASTEAASDKIQINVKSRMLEGENVSVIIILKDQPSLKALSKDNAVNYMKNLASSRQKSLASVLKEEISQGKANKIKQFWIMNAIAVEASPEVIEALSKRDDVESIELDSKVHVLEDFSTQVSQGQIDNATPELKRINATNVWELGIDGSGINVSVIDTGINASHPDIAGRVIKWIDYIGAQSSAYDDDGHGTHVAGTIGGNGSGGTTTGVAPNVSLFGVKALGPAGGSESDVIRGIEWSVSNGANVISMSIGTDEIWTTPNCDGENPAMATAIYNAVASGVVVVAAAGNYASGVSSPGCIQNTIVVGAVQSSDIIASFSGRGAAMTDHGVVAPGVTITSLDYASSGYVSADWSGTSMATPHVSGTVALLLHAANKQGTTFTPAQIKNIFNNSSIDLGNPGNDNIYGAGRINVSGAVFFIDTIGPNVVANPAGYTGSNTAARNGTAITLNATITDTISGMKNATVNVSHINASLTNVSLALNSGFWTNSSVIVNTSDGIYYLNITAYDHAGNVNNTAQITVIVDNTPPTITAAEANYPSGLTAAKNGTSIILNASISDILAGVKNATVNASQINRSLEIVILNNISGFYTNSTVIVNISDGIYLLNITSYDNASNKNDTVQIPVIVDNTPPKNITINSVSFQRGNAANNRSIIWFNVSADDPLINGVSSGIRNASLNASAINNTGWIALSNNSGFWMGNVTFDKSEDDDNYSLNVSFSDNAGNINNSLQVNISIDNTPPLVNDLSVTSAFINLTDSINITTNITSTDNVSQLNQSELFARVTYPNGTSIDYPLYGGSGSLFYKNFTDTAQYGRYNITILANDTTGNTNNSQHTQFATIYMTNIVVNITTGIPETYTAPYSNTSLLLSVNDSSNGTINISRSKVNITSNALNVTNPGIYVFVNASESIRNNLSYVILRVNYTDNDVSSYVESSLRLYRWNTTSSGWDKLSGAGSYPYVNDAGVDTENNFVWANLTTLSEFAVTGDVYVPPAQQSSSSNGGGGGGGGGASGENYSNIELKEKRDFHIFKDKVSSYKFNTTDPIIYVNITGNINAGEITTTVEVLRNTSSLVRNNSAPGIVYKNMNIWVGTSGFATPENIQKGVISFRVQNSWLKSSRATGYDVRMVRWDGTTWLEIETIKRSVGSDYTYYEAYTNSFSPFAITAVRSVRSAESQVEAIKTTIITETPVQEEIKIIQKKTPEINGSLLVTTVVLVIIVAILAALYLREREKRSILTPKSPQSSHYF